MLRREDGYDVEAVLHQDVQQMAVAHHAGMIGEDGNPLPFQKGEIFFGLFITGDDPPLLRPATEGYAAQEQGK